MNRLFILVVITCFFYSANARTQIDYLALEKDSLAGKNNTEKANYLYNKAAKMLYSDSAFQMATLAITFAEKCDCETVHMASHYTASYHAYLTGLYPIALHHQLKADSICKAEKIYDFYYQDHTLLGAIYTAMVNNSLAIKNYQKALLVAKYEHDFRRIGDTYVNIAAVYRGTNGTLNAKKYYRKALDCYQHNKIDGVALFNTYRGLATVCDEIEGALYLGKANAIAEKLNHPFYTVEYLADAGYFYERHGDDKKAERIYLECYELAYLHNFEAKINYSAGALAQLYKRNGQKDKALFYFEKYLDNEAKFLSNMPGIFHDLSELYAEKKQFKAAFEYANKAYSSKDSLTNLEKTDLLLAYDNRIELLEREEKIAKQALQIVNQDLVIAREQNHFYWLISSTIILVVLLFVLFQFFYFKQRKKKQYVDLQLAHEKELNGLRTNFLENIAHEIRTPITLINGHLELALEKADRKTAQQKHIREAQLSSKRVLSNANEILELLKLERGELPLQETEIHLESFLRRVFFTFESMAELKQVKLVFNSTISAAAFIRSDKGRLDKMISNYTTNAIKFAPVNSEICFAVDAVEQGLVFSIKDQGPGIAKAEHKKIFSRFYQAVDGRNIGGVGVGLSIVKEYAESLGGSVGVSSSVGKGATFFIELPIKIYEKAVKCVVQQQDDVQQHFPSLAIDNKPRILIVEDNPEMSAYLHEILADYFTCEVAFDGRSGLKKVQQQSYALILSDVMMPQMGGIELKEKINALPTCKNIPFIFITAKNQVTDRIRGYNLGIDDYIIKPFVKEELLIRINTLLAKKKQRELWLKDNLEFLDEKGNAQEQLLEKIKTVVLKNIDNTEFRVVDLAAAVGYSQRQLSRFLNKFVGLSPVQYILEIRLKKAHFYLSTGKYATLAEVRDRVGITSASYFNRKFLERFGVKPLAV